MWEASFIGVIKMLSDSNTEISGHAVLRGGGGDGVCVCVCMCVCVCVCVFHV